MKESEKVDLVIDGHVFENMLLGEESATGRIFMSDKEKLDFVEETWSPSKVSTLASEYKKLAQIRDTGRVLRGCWCVSATPDVVFSPSEGDPNTGTYTRICWVTFMYDEEVVSQ